MRGLLAPRGCVCQPLRETSRAKIKHGPILAGVFVDFAGVVTVVRKYGASLFGRMTTYINRFIAITTRYPGVRLQYCNLTDFMRGMIAINQLISAIRLISDAPYV